MTAKAMLLLRKSSVSLGSFDVPASRCRELS